MITVILPIFSSLFQGSSGSKLKVGCTTISKLWTTGTLVAAEGLPDKCAGTPNSNVIPYQARTRNAELRTTLPKVY